MESNNHWPLILIEGVLVFGGALAFGWWQLRSVKRDREALRLKREREHAEATQQQTGDSGSPGSDTGR